MSNFTPSSFNTPTRRSVNPVVVTIVVVVAIILIEVAFLGARMVNPIRARWETMQGLDAMRKRNLVRAEAHFKRAIRFNPGLTEAHKGLAATYQATRRAEAALKEYRELVRLNPQDVGLRVTYAALLDRSQRHADAERQLRDALKLDSEHAGANNNLAYLLSEQNRNLKEALKLAQKASLMESNSGFIWDTLGWVYYRLGDYKEAEYALRRALQFEPSTQDAAHYHLGMVLVGRKQRKEAKIHFNLVTTADEEFGPLAREALRKLEAGETPTAPTKPKTNVASADARLLVPGEERRAEGAAPSLGRTHFAEARKALA